MYLLNVVRVIRFVIIDMGFFVLNIFGLMVGYTSGNSLLACTEYTAYI